jgi:hypothetical protein
MSTENLDTQEEALLKAADVYVDDIFQQVSPILNDSFENMARAGITPQYMSVAISTALCKLLGCVASYAVGTDKDEAFLEDTIRVIKIYRDAFRGNDDETEVG